MSENMEPKNRTIIILIIGAFIIFLLSYGCILDWINKINKGLDWSLNLWYHPLTAIIGILFSILSVIFIIEKVSSGQIEKLKNFLESKKSVIMVCLVITVIAFISIIISVLLILDAGTTEFNGLVAFHMLMGIIFGVGLFMLLAKPFFINYINNPEKVQNYLSVIVIVAAIVLLTMVIVARAIGLISI